VTPQAFSQVAHDTLGLGRYFFFFFSCLTVISMFGISIIYAPHLYMTSMCPTFLYSCYFDLLYYDMRACIQHSTYSTVASDKYNLFNLLVLRLPPVLGSGTQRLFLNLFLSYTTSCWTLIDCHQPWIEATLLIISGLLAGLKNLFAFRCKIFCVMSLRSLPICVRSSARENGTSSELHHSTA